MIALHFAAGLFALYMLARHGPALFRARPGRAGTRNTRLVAALNVALALLILVTAVKGLARILI